MKVKPSIIALALGLALASAAHANLVLTSDSPFTPTNEKQATLEAEVGSRLGNPNLIDALRVEGQANGTTFDNANAVFQVAFNNTAGGQTATINFDLTGLDLSGVAILVFGGNLGSNLYTVTADQAIIGFGTVNAPLAGGSGLFADISHIDFFIQPGGASVPEGGTSAMLLAGSLTGLGIARRFVKRS